MRRLSGLGAVVFAVVFVVGVARAHALALVAGDDELCVAMGVAGVRGTAPAADPTDLADDHHRCCDFGLCLDASALPPSEAPAAVGRRVVRRERRIALPTPPRARRRRDGHRPRAPPLS